MVCEVCKARPATVHLTRVVDGYKTEAHLCEQCAKERGELDMFSVAHFPSFPSFSVQNLLAGLLKSEPTSPLGLGQPGQLGVTGATGAQAALLGSDRCKTCNIAYSDFAQTGFFGCSDCYASFRQRLDPLLRRIHGATTRHTGKVPQKAGSALRTRKEIDTLRMELKRLILNEEYEKAAQVRDRIRMLQGKMGRG